MPSTIIANPQLAQGGLVLLRHNTGRNSDGITTFNAEYACLSEFAKNYASTFTIRGRDALGRRLTNPPPPRLPNDSLIELSLELSAVQIVSSHGLTYFHAEYTAADRTFHTYAASQQLKAFSATRECSDLLGRPLPPGSLSFSYLATTVTVTNYDRPPPAPAAVRLVGPKFNVKGAGRCRIEVRPSARVFQNVSTTSGGLVLYTTVAYGFYEATSSNTRTSGN